MRRIIGYVLIGLGVAVLVLGVAVRTAIYPALAVAPAVYPPADAPKTDPQAGVLRSHGSNMQVFVARKPADGPGVTEVQKIDVDSVRTTASVPGASVGSDLFWKTQVDTKSPAVPGAPIKTTWEGVCFDRVSGMAASGCAQKDYIAQGEAIVPIKRDGLFFKFPVDTQQTTYPFWDSVAGRAFDAVYVGTDRIGGLDVYKFAQRIEKVAIPQVNKDGTTSKTVDVPGVAFGLPQDSPAVQAVDTYSNTRTLWVEPETGTIIKGTEDQKRVFVAEQGEVPEFVGLIGYTDATVAANVTQTKDAASGLHLLRVVLPVVAIVVGLLLLIGGLVLVFVLYRETSRGRRALGRPVDSDTGGVIDLRVGQPQRAEGA